MVSKARCVLCVTWELVCSLPVDIHWHSTHHCLLKPATSDGQLNSRVSRGSLSPSQNYNNGTTVISTQEQQQQQQQQHKKQKQQQQKQQQKSSSRSSTSKAVNLADTQRRFSTSPTFSRNPTASIVRSSSRDPRRARSRPTTTFPTAEELSRAPYSCSSSSIISRSFRLSASKGCLLYTSDAADE